MTVPKTYTNCYVPVKYFLSSHRALSDGRSGIHHLEDMRSKASFLFSEWKVIWIGTCAILRTAIDLFQVDAKSCIDSRIKEEIKAEWNAIKNQKADHAIFWEFLRKERDNVIHEYQWRAYETWLKPDGTYCEPSLGLLTLNRDDARPMLLMKDGIFKGRNSIELLSESADWVEARIFDAIRRAGFDPEEQRGLVGFQPRMKAESSLPGILSLLDASLPPK